LVAKVGPQRASSLSFNSWVMHDWVRLDTASLRLHHYRLRSREWMLKVRQACGSFCPPPPLPLFFKHTKLGTARLPL
jgi:hypothetical protein